MKRFLMLSATLLAILSCGEKPTPDNPTPDTPSAPTSISLSKSSFTAAQAGETLSLDITAPARPKLTGLPAWVSLKDGTFKDYKISLGLAVAVNDSYESRTATVTVSATGASDVSFTITQEGKTVVPDPTPGTNRAWQMARKLGLGWNMGNHMDAFYNGTWAGDNFLYPSETCWGSAPATQATFDGVKAAGFSSVRIPVTWLKMIGEAPDYKINETWLSRVYELVGFAEKAGLNVIINTHHDENHHSIIENGVDIDTRWLDILTASKNAEVNAAIKAEIKAVWTQIAEKFKDKGDWLIFESFNELNDGGWGWSADFRADPTKQCNILNEWNQVFVDAVRATGGNNATRWLGVPTYAANPSFEQYAKMAADPAGKLMLSVHFYDPSDYTIGDEQWSDWGHTGAAGKKSNGGDEDHVKDVFGNLFQKYVDKDIPVYVGEFGCSMRAQSDARAWAFYLYYMEYVVKAAKVYGLPAFLWDNGASGAGKEQHGYIDHGTGGYIGNSKTVIDLMVKAMNSTDKNYTLQSVYDKAPKF